MKSSATRRKRAEVNSRITPDTAFSVNLKQAVIIIAIVLGAGSAYAYVVWTQAAQSKDIADIKSTQATSTVAVTAITKDQEEKRAALGREFLASNQAIVAKLGDLTILVAVQQERQKTADEKLGKVLDQIGAVLQQTPRR